MKETDNVFSYANERGSHHGLTARDYIAIQAMVGILANSHVLPGGSEKNVAEMAYKQADAMIKESEK